MPRAPRDPRLTLDRPGQKPLLQGHLRRGGRPTPDVATPVDATPEATQEVATPEDATPAPTGSAQPAAEGSVGDAAAKRGKATRSPAAVATRRNLEGSEQGPV